MLRYLLVFLLLSVQAFAQITTTPASPFNLGTPAITDTGVGMQITGVATSYYQIILQNTSNAATASADVIVNNNLGTATTYYGDFGINSSTYTGSGSFNLANATYLSSATGDLVLGTVTANAIHFVINNGATDAAIITTTGTIGIGTAAPRNSAVLDVNGGLNISSTTLITTSTALTNGAAGNVGTLTNAPAVGNPTKWVPINDNGTTRYIPAW